jgi:hypothetical protein
LGVAFLRDYGWENFFWDLRAISGWQIPDCLGDFLSALAMDIPQISYCIYPVTKLVKFLDHDRLQSEDSEI